MLAIGATVIDGGGPAARTTGLSTGSTRATATVTSRDLVEREELDGTLGYGATKDVSLGSPGTITALPEEGAVVDRGGVIAEVDGRAVRLLFGIRPLWRQLDAGVSDGPDVRQLEENLVALGHARPSSLTVDDTWTDATTQAVKRWQKAMGVEQTGTVAPAQVVVLPAAVRVAEHRTTIGAAAAGGTVLTVTGTEQVVTSSPWARPSRSSCRTAPAPPPPFGPSPPWSTRRPTRRRAGSRRSR